MGHVVSSLSLTPFGALLSQTSLFLLFRSIRLRSLASWSPALSVCRCSLYVEHLMIGGVVRIASRPPFAVMTSVSLTHPEPLAVRAEVSMALPRHHLTSVVGEFPEPPFYTSS